MLRRMVSKIHGLLLALAVAATPLAAAAADYVVVRSSEATIARGRAFAAGERVALPLGAAITLMHASGDVVTLKGAAGGITLPKHAATPKDADRMAVLRFILSAAPSETGARATRSRGGVCPPAEALVTLDAIVQVQQGGCAEQAAQALDAFLLSAPETTP